MILNRKSRILTLALMSLAVQMTWAGITLRPESWLRLEGDSTLHPYSSTATAIDVAMEPVEAAPPAASLWSMMQGKNVKSLTVSIPVEGLKSGEKGLDKNMYATLQADRFPDIRCRLDEYEISSASGAASFSIRASGKLQIAGQEKPLALQADLQPAQDAVRVRGSYRLLMTDFGVKPPTFMMGVLKVRDPITIRFDLSLSLTSDPDKSNPQERRMP